MKQLSPITVGKYAIEASVEHDVLAGAVLTVTVKFGEESLSGKLNHQGAHDHSEEQFEKDVNDFAVRLATDLAARMRSSELARKFTQS